MIVIQKLQIVVPGEPIAKGRPRFASRGGYAVAYTPKRTANYENLVATAFQQKFPDWIPTDKPVEVDMKAYFSIPKSFSKKKILKAKENEVRPLKKPDTDNLLKIMDALNQIAWIDDKQVFASSCEKFYSDQPRLEIKIAIYEEQ